MTIPDGYTYSGALTVTVSLTVEADTAKAIVNISPVAGAGELPSGVQKSDVRLPIEQMVQAQGVTEQLKAENQMTWVGAVSNI